MTSLVTASIFALFVLRFRIRLSPVSRVHLALEVQLAQQARKREHSVSFDSYFGPGPGLVEAIDERGAVRSKGEPRFLGPVPGLRRQGQQPDVVRFELEIFDHLPPPGTR